MNVPAKQKKVEQEITLSERDLMDAVEVAKIHKSPGLEAIGKHAAVKEEQILELIIHNCNMGDKDKVFAWACQLAGFRRRSLVEQQIIDRMNEFIDDQKDTKEVIPNDGRREDEP